MAAVECGQREKQFFQIVEANGQELDQVIDAMQKGLDLEHGPLLRVTHVKPNLLVVVIHHLAIDGVSWRILLEDLDIGYRKQCQGKEIRLPGETTPTKSGQRTCHGLPKQPDIKKN